MARKRNRKLQRLIRARMAERGISYMEARRQVEAEHAKRADGR